MTDAAFFAQNKRVVAAVQKIKQNCANRLFSDIIDGAGHQYVDLVMEGGGVLGIALTGYTYALEQAGIRFLGIGGTSAGSINALLIAALGKPEDAKSEKLVNVLANIPMASFIDGDSDARDFSQAVIEKAGMVKLLWKAAQVMDNLNDDLGLNPGKAFLKWLGGELKTAGIRTNADLRRNLESMPASLKLRDGTALKDEDKCGRLAMVAADITTETKVEFPRMAALYWTDPDQVDPALFARASMSIPIFFHPFRVNDCPQDRKQAWEKLANYYGELPKAVLFIDGGIMSNFPINLFHQPYSVPRAPTFGAKIGIDRSKPVTIGKPAQLVGAIFDTARHTLDYEFIAQNPDYKHLVTMIDTGSHNWLNFNMEDDDKADLFALGAEAGAEFLCKFDWPKYKEIREGIKKAFLASNGG
jgi:NTE family protein